MVDLLKGATSEPGLYYFRVIVRFLLTEDIIEEDENGEPIGRVQGFYRTYGVSAKTMSEAATILEDSLWKHQATGGDDDPKCEIKMFQLDILDPASIDLDTDDWKATPGIHFISGRCFYSGDESPKDNDITGWEAIQDELSELDGSDDEQVG